jgi:hypothetical protein
MGRFRAGNDARDGKYSKKVKDGRGVGEKVNT